MRRVVAGILINDQQEVLLSCRPEGKSFAGYWEFTGGKVEKGESLEAALNREWQEELAVQVRGGRPWLRQKVVREDISLDLFFWRLTDGDIIGTPRAQEGQCLMWLSVKALGQVKLLPSNLFLIDYLMLPNELIITPVGLSDKSGKLLFACAPGRGKKGEKLYYPENNIRAFSDITEAAVGLHNREGVEKAAAAHIWVWEITDKQSLNDLQQLLKEGASLPIYARYADDEIKATLWSLGIQGFIIEGESIAV
ncbi:MAG: hypothetical protein DI620_00945 [Haemophilus parainfluenzae]|jgi:hypothetical protein|nr:MAG: hypothetical protein DI620_00945 [Haemophilus parainfluenzae]